MSTEEKSIKVTFTQKLGALSYRVLCGILRVTDVRAVALLGRVIGYLVWLCSASRRRIVARNMRIVVDPRLRPDKLSSMVRRNIVRTTMNLACSLKSGIMSDREMKRSIHVVGRSDFLKSGVNGHTAIACIPHAGNWEILARTRPLFSEIDHYGCMYRRLSNPLLEQIVYKSRTKYGCEMFSKEDGLRAVFKLARSGGLLGVLSDQFTQEGRFLPYFGKVTGVTPLPALIYKRCKGKGTLYSVYTRNIALGQWEAIMNKAIDLPKNCDDLDEITLHVNHALERCQKENIIDGFWMHHRWKCTSNFAPENAFNDELIRKNATLPFRILVCVPERFEESAIILPAIRVLKRSRVDAQLTIVCPEEQKAYWQQHSDDVSYVATTDGECSLTEQLLSDELYKDGPFDILFMYSENARVMRQLQKFRPFFVSGFNDNPLTRKFKFNTRYIIIETEEILPRAKEYLIGLHIRHKLPIAPEVSAPMQGNEEVCGNFIAPFSTLGSADSWEHDKWAELIRELGGATLLALPQDKERALKMAEELGCELCLCAPEEMSTKLGSRCKLYAVDGLLPTLAAQVGCCCCVLMASRHPERYPLMGKGHRYLSNHLPCHPCMRGDCDQATPCTSAITVENMLNA